MSRQNIMTGGGRQANVSDTHWEWCTRHKRAAFSKSNSILQCGHLRNGSLIVCGPNLSGEFQIESFKHSKRCCRMYPKAEDTFITKMCYVKPSVYVKFVTTVNVALQTIQTCGHVRACDTDTKLCTGVMSNIKLEVAFCNPSLNHKNHPLLNTCNLLLLLMISNPKGTPESTLMTYHCFDNHMFAWWQPPWHLCLLCFSCVVNFHVLT